MFKERVEKCCTLCLRMIETDNGLCWLAYVRTLELRGGSFRSKDFQDLIAALGGEIVLLRRGEAVKVEVTHMDNT